MRKISSIILILLLLLCLFGCQSKDSTSINCRNCDKQIEKAAIYCQYCGELQNVSSNEDNNEEKDNSSTNENKSVEQNKSEIVTTFTCVKCGASCELNHSYCKEHECSYSHCLMQTKSGSNYCDSHACLLCKKVRSSGSAYCTGHKCSNCNNASVGSSKFCVAHKCMLCDKEAWSNGYCSKHEP